jgi:hypothetical protein
MRGEKEYTLTQIDGPYNGLTLVLSQSHMNRISIALQNYAETLDGEDRYLATTMHESIKRFIAVTDSSD